MGGFPVPQSGCQALPELLNYSWIRECLSSQLGDGKTALFFTVYSCPAASSWSCCRLLLVLLATVPLLASSSASTSSLVPEIVEGNGPPAALILLSVGTGLEVLSSDPGSVHVLDKGHFLLIKILTWPLKQQTLRLVVDNTQLSLYQRASVHYFAMAVNFQERRCHKITKSTKYASLRYQYFSSPE